MHLIWVMYRIDCSYHVNTQRDADIAARQQRIHNQGFTIKDSQSCGLPQEVGLVAVGQTATAQRSYSVDLGSPLVMEEEMQGTLVVWYHSHRPGH